MAVPDLETITLPLLEFLKDEKPHTVSEVERHLAKIFELTDEEKRQEKPSGGESLFHNRIHWSKFYLKKAMLIDGKPRGTFWITSRGKSVLKNKPGKIDSAYLMQFKEFSEFVGRRAK